MATTSSRKARTKSARSSATSALRATELAPRERGAAGRAGVLRLSFGPETTQGDIDALYEALLRHKNTRFSML